MSLCLMCFVVGCWKFLWKRCWKGWELEEEERSWWVVGWWDGAVLFQADDDSLLAKPGGRQF
jgi:hypothetical protein